MTQLKVLSSGLKGKKYWYMTVHEMCPVCGEEREYKYRVYDVKPKEITDRHQHTYINHYCYV